MFQCRTAVFREDVTLEPQQITGCLDRAGLRFPQGLIESDEPHSVYVATLWEYSNRKLSFDTDVINAFTGILRVLHRRMVGNDDLVNPGSGLICGLPVAVFDWALLWEPVLDLKERSGAMWPSWSWCGWNGRASLLLSGMKESELQDWLCQRTWIKWIVVECRNDTATPLLSSVDYVERQNLLFPSDVYPPVTQSSHTEESDQPILHKIQTHWNRSCSFLYFATLSMAFSVQAIDTFQGSWQGYKICEVDGTSCGKIWLDPRWEYVPGQKYEFLALSEAKSSEISRIELELHLEGDKSDASEWDAYHVLLISYPRADTPAERIGIGIILQDSMREVSGAVWKEVWLQ